MASITTPSGAKVQVGDVITYSAFGGVIRTGVVASVSDDIKRGRPGFDLNDFNGQPLGWGYADQITAP